MNISSGKDFTSKLITQPVAYPFLCVSSPVLKLCVTQDEDTDEAPASAGAALSAVPSTFGIGTLSHAGITPINEKISPPRPISLDIQSNYHIKACSYTLTKGSCIIG